MDKFGYCLVGFVSAALIGIMLHFAFPSTRVQSVPYGVVKRETTYVKQDPIIKEDVISKAKLSALDKKYQALLTEWSNKPDASLLQAEANEYWQRYYLMHPEALQGVYSAKTDSVIQDSLITISASYISPIPLHPMGFFMLSYEVKPPPAMVIRETVMIQEDKHWYNHFGLQVGFGTVYSQTSKQVSLGYYLGAGYSYNF